MLLPHPWIYSSLEQVILLEELSLEMESSSLILPLNIKKIKKNPLKNTNLRNSLYILQ